MSSTFISDFFPTCVDFKTVASTENSVQHGLKLVPWLGLPFIKRKPNEIDLVGDPACMWQQIVQVGERLWWRKCHQVRKDLRRGCIVRSLISFNFRGSALGHAHLKQPEPKTRTTGIHRNFQLRFKNQSQIQ